MSEGHLKKIQTEEKHEVQPGSSPVSSQPELRGGVKGTCGVQVGSQDPQHLPGLSETWTLGHAAWRNQALGGWAVVSV